MPERITQVLNSDVATAGGILNLVGFGFLKLRELMTLDNFNNLLEFGMVVGGLVFLFYKIQGQRLDNKKKRKDLKDE